LIREEEESMVEGQIVRILGIVRIILAEFVELGQDLFRR
jgi:hypothetical protein